jgi:hypothetical protein
MLPGACTLPELNKSADPGRPYFMLAGNIAIIPAATELTGVENGSLLGRVLVCLNSPDLLHKFANPSFLGQASDIAVSVTSMENIAPGRKPAYDVRPWRGTTFRTPKASKPRPPSWPKGSDSQTQYSGCSKAASAIGKGPEIL